jgi:hypothetical protein
MGDEKLKNSKIQKPKGNQTSGFLAEHSSQSFGF